MSTRVHTEEGSRARLSNTVTHGIEIKLIKIKYTLQLSLMTAPATLSMLRTHPGHRVAQSSPGQCALQDGIWNLRDHL